MSAVGGYKYVVFNQAGDGFIEVGKKVAQQNPRTIGLFIAGGKAIDKKVQMANELVQDVYSAQIKQVPAKKGNSVLGFIKQAIKMS